MDIMNGAAYYPANSDEMTPAIQMEAISFTGKDPDTIKYLLLLKVITNDNYDNAVYSWHVSIGRQATYDYLKKLITNVVVDTDSSYVLSEGSKDFDKTLSVRRFMIMVKEQQMVTDFTDWNVDDYRLDPTIGDQVLPLSECNDDHCIEELYAV